jgi:hypothetical protein
MWMTMEVVRHLLRHKAWQIFTKMRRNFRQIRKSERLFLKVYTFSDSKVASLYSFEANKINVRSLIFVKK